MARKSRWQQFADSFNAVYGTFNKAFEDIETSKLMKQEFKDDAGNALAGDDLDRARYRALADIKTKYGDAAGGLALRSNAAALESTTFANDLNRELRPELLAQRGVLQSGLMGAQINSANAGAANNYANANATNTLLAGRVVAQDLTNQGLGLDVDYKGRTIDYRVDQAQAAADKATVDAEIAKETKPDVVTEAGADARKAQADATNAEIAAAETLATTNERVAATLAELKAAATEAGNRVTSAEASARDNSVISDIFRESIKMDFDTTEAANAWLIEQFASADISPQARLSAAQTVNQFGAEVIGARAVEITQALRRGWQEGGLTGQIDAYNSVFDGAELRDERDGDTTRVMIKRGDGDWEVFDEATGSVAEAEAELGRRLQALGDNPMTMMEVAAAEASLAQTKAETARTEAQTGLIDAQEFSEVLERDRTQAQTALLFTQLRQTEQEIAAAEKAGDPNEQALREIAVRGLTNMMGDTNFGLLRPDEQEAMVARYRAEFGLSGNSFDGWSFEVVD